jgi:adenylosuccinate lyase
VIPRYSPPEIAAIFSDESRLQRWLEVELLACEGWAALGMVPQEAIPLLRRARVDIDRVNQLEAEQGHDLAAFVSAVQETLGEEGRHLHYGLTSSDVVDTALATQLRDAARIVDADAAALEGLLLALAMEHRGTVMAGRTHGIHAEPITLGVKLANHLDELRRSRGRLAQAATEIAVGKITGAVGTHTAVPPQVEEHVCRGLGLEVAPAATQVIARDRHAALVNAMALLGAVLERLATTVRLAQQTDVAELAEPFGSRQKGSSAMPHKRNPILSERVCGIARVLRGHALTAMENVALWHERDISHSSAERVILPDAFCLLDYSLRTCSKILNGLRVDAARMRENLWRSGGVVFSQKVLSALIEAGWARERAYRQVQHLASRALEGEGGFQQLVEADGDIVSALGAAGLRECFDPSSYLAHIDETYRRMGIEVNSNTAAAAVAGRGDRP